MYSSNESSYIDFNFVENFVEIIALKKISKGSDSLGVSSTWIHFSQKKSGIQFRINRGYLAEGSSSNLNNSSPHLLRESPRKYPLLLPLRSVGYHKDTQRSHSWICERSLCLRKYYPIILISDTMTVPWILSKRNNFKITEKTFSENTMV